MVQLVGVEGFELGDAGSLQFLEQGLGDLVVGAGDDLTGFLVDDIAGDHPTEQKLAVDRQLLDAGRLQVADVLGGDALVLGNDDLAVFVGDVEARGLALQTLGLDFVFDALLGHMEGLELEEHGQDFFGAVAQGLEQDGDWHLAPTVDPEKDEVLGIEFEVEPGAAVGDDPGREQELARAVGLAPVMLEEDTGRAVQLGNDDALGPIDHEGTGRGHERNLAHIDLLLLHLLDLFLGAFAVEDDQTHPGAQARGIGQAALLALDDVEQRLAQGIADELQARTTVVTGDRENGFERRLQTDILALVRSNVFLQELVKGLKLGGQQIGHRQDADAFGEALADAFFLGECVAHGDPLSGEGDQGTEIDRFLHKRQVREELVRRGFFHLASAFPDDAQVFSKPKGRRASPA